MKIVAVLVAFIFLYSCSGESHSEDEVIVDISTDDIDKYVATKNGEDQIYDVARSLRFSSDEETYEVINFSQNDSLILFQEIVTTDNDQVVRMTYYKDSLPVYVSEIIASNTEELPITERKVYLDGSHILNGYEKKASQEFDLEFIEFEEISVEVSEFDFDRPKNALAQRGEFEMTFQEFLIMDPQTFLILENEESGFDAALFVAEEHPFITEVRENEEAYRGKAIFVAHQFILTNNIERMLFMDGYVTADGMPDGFDEEIE